jgi:hypothetical protein
MRVVISKNVGLWVWTLFLSSQPQRVLDDRNKVPEIVGQPIENLACEAYAIIEVQQKMLVLLSHDFPFQTAITSISQPHAGSYLG